MYLKKRLFEKYYYKESAFHNVRSMIFYLEGRFKKIARRVSPGDIAEIRIACGNYAFSKKRRRCSVDLGFDLRYIWKLNFRLENSTARLDDVALAVGALARMYTRCIQMRPLCPSRGLSLRRSSINPPWHANNSWKKSLNVTRRYVQSTVNGKSILWITM